MVSEVDKVEDLVLIDIDGTMEIVIDGQLAINPSLLAVLKSMKNARFFLVTQRSMATQAINLLNLRTTAMLVKELAEQGIQVEVCSSIDPSYGPMPGKYYLDRLASFEEAYLSMDPINPSDAARLYRYWKHYEELVVYAPELFISSPTLDEEAFKAKWATDEQAVLAKFIEFHTNTKKRGGKHPDDKDPQYAHVVQHVRQQYGNKVKVTIFEDHPEVFDQVVDEDFQVIDVLHPAKSGELRKSKYKTAEELMAEMSALPIRQTLTKAGTATPTEDEQREEALMNAANNLKKAIGRLAGAAFLGVAPSVMDELVAIIKDASAVYKARVRVGKRKSLTETINEPGMDQLLPECIQAFSLYNTNDLIKISSYIATRPRNSIENEAGYGFTAVTAALNYLIARRREFFKVIQTGGDLVEVIKNIYESAWDKIDLAGAYRPTDDEIKESFIFVNEADDNLLQQMLRQVYTMQVGALSEGQRRIINLFCTEVQHAYVRRYGEKYFAGFAGNEFVELRKMLDEAIPQWHAKDSVGIYAKLYDNRVKILKALLQIYTPDLKQQQLFGILFNASSPVEQQHILRDVHAHPFIVHFLNIASYQEAAFMAESTRLSHPQLTADSKALQKAPLDFAVREKEQIQKYIANPLEYCQELVNWLLVNNENSPDFKQAKKALSNLYQQIKTDLESLHKKPYKQIERLLWQYSPVILLLSSDLVRGNIFNVLAISGDMWSPLRDDAHLMLKVTSLPARFTEEINAILKKQLQLNKAYNSIKPWEWRLIIDYAATGDIKRKATLQQRFGKEFTEVELSEVQVALKEIFSRWQLINDCALLDNQLLPTIERLAKMDVALEDEFGNSLLKEQSVFRDYLLFQYAGAKLAFSADYNANNLRALQVLESSYHQTETSLAFAGVAGAIEKSIIAVLEKNFNDFNAASSSVVKIKQALKKLYSDVSKGSLAEAAKAFAGFKKELAVGTSSLDEKLKGEVKAFNKLFKLILNVRKLCFRLQYAENASVARSEFKAICEALTELQKENLPESFNALKTAIKQWITPPFGQLNVNDNLYSIDMYIDELERLASLHFTPVHYPENVQDIESDLAFTGQEIKSSAEEKTVAIKQAIMDQLILVNNIHEALNARNLTFTYKKLNNKLDEVLLGDNWSLQLKWYRSISKLSAETVNNVFGKDKITQLREKLTEHFYVVLQENDFVTVPFDQETKELYSQTLQFAKLLFTDKNSFETAQENLLLKEQAKLLAKIQEELTSPWLSDFEQYKSYLIKLKIVFKQIDLPVVQDLSLLINEHFDKLKEEVEGAIFYKDPRKIARMEALVENHIDVLNQFNLRVEVENYLAQINQLKKNVELWLNKPVEYYRDLQEILEKESDFLEAFDLLSSVQKAILVTAEACLPFRKQIEEYLERPYANFKKLLRAHDKAFHQLRVVGLDKTANEIIAKINQEIEEVYSWLKEPIKYYQQLQTISQCKSAEFLSAFSFFEQQAEEKLAELNDRFNAFIKLLNQQPADLIVIDQWLHNKNNDFAGLVRLPVFAAQWQAQAQKLTDDAVLVLLHQYNVNPLSDTAYDQHLNNAVSILVTSTADKSTNELRVILADAAMENCITKEELRSLDKELLDDSQMWHFANKANGSVLEKCFRAAHHYAVRAEQADEKNQFAKIAERLASYRSKQQVSKPKLIIRTSPRPAVSEKILKVIADAKRRKENPANFLTQAMLEDLYLDFLNTQSTSVPEGLFFAAENKRESINFCIKAAEQLSTTAQGEQLKHLNKMLISFREYQRQVNSERLILVNPFNDNLQHLSDSIQQKTAEVNRNLNIESQLTQLSQSASLSDMQLQKLLVLLESSDIAEFKLDGSILGLIEKAAPIATLNQLDKLYSYLKTRKVRILHLNDVTKQLDELLMFYSEMQSRLAHPNQNLLNLNFVAVTAIGVAQTIQLDPVTFANYLKRTGLEDQVINYVQNKLNQIPKTAAELNTLSLENKLVLNALGLDQKIKQAMTDWLNKCAGEFNSANVQALDEMLGQDFINGTPDNRDRILKVKCEDWATEDTRMRLLVRYDLFSGAAKDYARLRNEIRNVRKSTPADDIVGKLIKLAGALGEEFTSAAEATLVNRESLISSHGISRDQLADEIIEGAKAYRKLLGASAEMTYFKKLIYLAVYSRHPSIKDASYQQIASYLLTLSPQVAQARWQELKTYATKISDDAGRMQWVEHAAKAWAQDSKLLFAMQQQINALSADIPACVKKLIHIAQFNLKPVVEAFKYFSLNAIPQILFEINKTNKEVATTLFQDETLQKLVLDKLKNSSEETRKQAIDLFYKATPQFLRSCLERELNDMNLIVGQRQGGAIATQDVYDKNPLLQTMVGQTDTSREFAEYIRNLSLVSNVLPGARYEFVQMNSLPKAEILLLELEKELVKFVASSVPTVVWQDGFLHEESGQPLSPVALKINSLLTQVQQKNIAEIDRLINGEAILADTPIAQYWNEAKAQEKFADIFYSVNQLKIAISQKQSDDKTQKNFYEQLVRYLKKHPSEARGLLTGFNKDNEENAKVFATFIENDLDILEMILSDSVLLQAFTRKSEKIEANNIPQVAKPLREAFFVEVSKLLNKQGENRLHRENMISMKLYTSELGKYLLAGEGQRDKFESKFFNRGLMANTTQQFVTAARQKANGKIREVISPISVLNDMCKNKKGLQKKQVGEFFFEMMATGIWPEAKLQDKPIFSYLQTQRNILAHLAATKKIDANANAVRKNLLNFIDSTSVENKYGPLDRLLYYVKLWQEGDQEFNAELIKKIYTYYPALKIESSIQEKQKFTQQLLALAISDTQKFNQLLAIEPVYRFIINSSNDRLLSWLDRSNNEKIPEVLQQQIKLNPNLQDKITQAMTRVSKSALEVARKGYVDNFQAFRASWTSQQLHRPQKLRERLLDSDYLKALEFQKFKGTPYEMQTQVHEHVVYTDMTRRTSGMTYLMKFSNGTDIKDIYGNDIISKALAEKEGSIQAGTTKTFMKRKFAHGLSQFSHLYGSTAAEIVFNERGQSAEPQQTIDRELLMYGREDFLKNEVNHLPVSYKQTFAELKDGRSLRTHLYNSLRYAEWDSDGPKFAELKDKNQGKYMARGYVERQIVINVNKDVLDSTYQTNDYSVVLDSLPVYVLRLTNSFYKLGLDQLHHTEFKHDLSQHLWERLQDLQSRFGDHAGINKWLASVNLSQLTNVVEPSTLANAHDPFDPWHQVHDFYNEVKSVTMVQNLLGLIEQLAPKQQVTSKELDQIKRKREKLELEIIDLMQNIQRLEEGPYDPDKSQEKKQYQAALAEKEVQLKQENFKDLKNKWLGNFVTGGLPALLVCFKQESIKLTQEQLEFLFPMLHSYDLRAGGLFQVYAYIDWCNSHVNDSLSLTEAMQKHIDFLDSQLQMDRTEPEVLHATVSEEKQKVNAVLHGMYSTSFTLYQEIFLQLKSQTPAIDLNQIENEQELWNTISNIEIRGNSLLAELCAPWANEFRKAVEEDARSAKQLQNSVWAEKLSLRDGLDSLAKVDDELYKSLTKVFNVNEFDSWSDLVRAVLEDDRVDLKVEHEKLSKYITCLQELEKLEQELPKLYNIIFKEELFNLTQYENWNYDLMLEQVVGNEKLYPLIQEEFELYYKNESYKQDLLVLKCMFPEVWELVESTAAQYSSWEIFYRDIRESDSIDAYKASLHAWDDLRDKVAVLKRDYPSVYERLAERMGQDRIDNYRTWNAFFDDVQQIKDAELIAEFAKCCSRIEDSSIPPISPRKAGSFKSDTAGTASLRGAFGSRAGAASPLTGSYNATIFSAAAASRVEGPDGEPPSARRALFT